MRIIGIDPGSAVTGFGIVEGAAGVFSHIAAGTIRAPRGASHPDRLHNIYRHLRAIIDEHAPQAMSLERNFVAINIQSAFRLGEARAIAMLAAAERGLELYEYTPTQVKMTIAGFGAADKAQVKAMVRRTLRMDASIALVDDAADALAIATCHLFRARFASPARSAATRAANGLSGGGIIE
ncbi:MAG TPA: crossover junction endodeoxyribonuclease RuvC [Candidatus Binataceae bacterium]|nr:crossover junction endodeoxyribonuclease RuvC [Candidatus Binataceae bacterium]